MPASLVSLLAVLTGLSSLIILALPLWLGWGLRTFIPKEKFSFESYEREGWGRFSLNQAELTFPQVQISVAELNATSPLNWVRIALFEGSSSLVLNMEGVEILIPLEQPDTSDKEPSENQTWKSPGSAMAWLNDQIQKTDRWLPSANVNQLTVIRGDQQFHLDNITWQNRTLELAGRVEKYPDYPFTLSLDFTEGSPTASGEIPAADLKIETTVGNAGNKWVAHSSLLYQQNQAVVDVGFGDQSWYPEFATWQLGQWNIDLKTTGLNSVYDLLEFNLAGGWKAGAISNTLDGNLSMEPEAQEQQLPPVDFKSEVNGNTRTLELAEFSLSAPGITADMRDPVSFDLSEQKLSGNLHFNIDFDLGVLNLKELQGRMTGLIDMATDSGKPVGQFNLVGSDVKIQAYEFEELKIEAGLNWPVLQLHTLNAQLSDGSKLLAKGIANLESKEINSASLEGTIHRTTLADYSPEELEWETLSFSSQISGPINDIAHTGTLEIPSVETPAIKPVSAQVNWSGQALDIGSLEVVIQNDEAGIAATASGNLHQTRMSWEITDLTLEVNDSPLATLAEEATVLIEPAELTRLTLSNIQLEGSELHLSVEGDLLYPASARWDVNASGIQSTQWLNPWLKTPVPDINLKTLSTTGEWNEGPVNFDGNLNAALIINEKPVRAMGAISSDGRAIHFRQLEISDTQGPWLTIDGEAPVSLHPAAEKKLQIEKSGPVNLKLQTTDSRNWLAWLSSLSSFDFKTFDSNINLHGSLEELGGGFKIDLATAEKTGEHTMPSTRVQSEGTIDRNTLVISAMQVSVLEEVFKVSGSIGLPVSLVHLIDNPSSDIAWQDTAFDLQIPPSKLTPMRYFFPQLLSTGGEIEANLKGSLSGGTTGYFRIKGMNTRAVFPFGSLRDLSAELAFEKSRAQLKNISGYIGREPATISGHLDYAQWGNPTYQFTLKGSDLPLVRKPGLLLRSDLDLAISKKKDEASRITGTVNLKDGLYLLNRSNLLAGGSGGGRSASTRPPYFSVDIPPLSGWELDVDVKGEKFMRIRTPAADGILSLEMRLQGKLREPFATGRLSFDEGNILFPFSSFNIDYGVAELPIDNPYTPFVEILGSSRRFGYDLGVEITGSAYDPQVKFTSSPPLSSEQIMLMVMAGENPDGIFDYSTTQRASMLGTYISRGLFASGSRGGFLGRLDVSSGENLSEQGKETLEIEYALDDRWQVVGEYDEYDFWNVGLRYRILKRHVQEENEEVREP